MTEQLVLESVALGGAAALTYPWLPIPRVILCTTLYARIGNYSTYFFEELFRASELVSGLFAPSALVVAAMLIRFCRDDRSYRSLSSETGWSCRFIYPVIGAVVDAQSKRLVAGCWTLSTECIRVDNIE